MIKVYALLALLAGLGASHWFAYHKGGTATEIKYALQAAEIRQEYAAELQAQLDEIRELENEWLNEEAKIVYKTKIKKQEVIKYVDRIADRECFDNDGLQLFNKNRTR